jgi:hypothetical protein
VKIGRRKVDQRERHVVDECSADVQYALICGSECPSRGVSDDQPKVVVTQAAEPIGQQFLLLELLGSRGGEVIDLRELKQRSGCHARL